MAATALVLEDDEGPCISRSEILSNFRYRQDMTWGGLTALELSRLHHDGLTLLDSSLPCRGRREHSGSLMQVRADTMGALGRGLAVICEGASERCNGRCKSRRPDLRQ
jgi:hypothetical protein